MKTIFAILAFCVVVFLLLQVGPVLADGPDHRPDAGEQTATWTVVPRPTSTSTPSEQPGHPARPHRATATATEIVYPYPPVETEAPYPMPEQSGGFIEWLRRLFGGEWRVE